VEIEEVAAIEMAVVVMVKMVVATEIAVPVRKGRRMAAAVHRGHRMVLERTSACECSFQGQPYMGPYISRVLE
jgi:hypothetical protein